MSVVLSLLGLAALIAAIAPVAMAGGQMIAAFMMGKHIVGWVAITLGTMVALVAGGVLAMQVVQPILGQTYGPLASLVMIVPPWLMFWLGRRVMDKQVAMKDKP
jgi:hypothetical protein